MLELDDKSNIIKKLLLIKVICYLPTNFPSIQPGRQPTPAEIEFRAL